VRAPSSTLRKRQAVLTGSYGHAQIHCPSRALMFFLWRATHVGQTVYRSLGCDNQRRRHLCHLRRCHHCASACAAAIAMSFTDSDFRIKQLSATQSSPRPVAPQSSDAMATSGYPLRFDRFGNQLDSKRAHDLSNGIEFRPRCFLEGFVEALARKSRSL